MTNSPHEVPRGGPQAGALPGIGHLFGGTRRDRLMMGRESLRGGQRVLNGVSGARERGRASAQNEMIWVSFENEMRSSAAMNL